MKKPLLLFAVLLIVTAIQAQRIELNLTSYESAVYGSHNITAMEGSIVIDLDENWIWITYKNSESNFPDGYKIISMKNFDSEDAIGTNLRLQDYKYYYNAELKIYQSDGHGYLYFERSKDYSFIYKFIVRV
jgi:hypothetical protein